MTRLLAGLWRHVTDRWGLINTTDAIVAAGAGIILAAGVASVSLAGFSMVRLGKAQPEAQDLATAMQSFFRDTGKWPGQAEVAATTFRGTASPRFLVSDISAGAFLPSFGASVFTTGTTVCSANSLEGFAGGVSISGLSQPASGASVTPLTNLLNVNDYLVRRPDPTKYPNWRGPYMEEEITSDPFGRVWLINTMPLFCAEDVDVVEGALGAGNLGYAWIITAGPNRTLTTPLGSARLDPDGDDAGVNLSKLTKKTSRSGS